MTLYVDSSALVKRYVEEDDSDVAEAALLGDREWVTANHTFIEIALALHRRLDEPQRRIARTAFDRDWSRTYIVALTDAACRRAAEIGFVTGARSLDALHLAAAEQAGGRSLPFMTFDLRLAHAARSLGFTVIGT